MKAWSIAYATFGDGYTIYCSSEASPRQREPVSGKWSGNDLTCESVKSGLVLLFANLSCCDFSASSGGVHEVKRHISTKKHTELAETSAGQTKLIAPRCKTTGVPEDKVITADVYYATFIAEHNLPFLVADHFTKLCKVMFPDSKIVQEFAKLQVKHALAPAHSEVIKTCCTSPFILLCDGGSDQTDR